MTGSLIIPPRFCGPPGSGNGGYFCGLVAGFLDGPAEVTLRRPPPLDRPLAIEHDDRGRARVLDGDVLIAEAAGVPGDAGLQLPEPVSVQEAEAAGARSPMWLHPELHPFPACFVCGPQRAAGDGLRIGVGPVPGSELWADVWQPAQEFADAAGNVRPEFVWAALDCPGGFAVLPGAGDDAAYLLGRLAARQLGPMRAGEPHVVAGWRLAAEGRKTIAGSALFTAAGQPVAVARATWIRLERPGTVSA
jgi:hypothetical protein